VIALCDFPNAQGYALVTDIAAHRTAMGVTADSIPYPFVRARTHHPLLFSTVSNQNGIDTAISIANTSSDPFGTTPGSGTCTLNYFGSTTGGGAAPPAQTSARVPAGESLVFSLSGGGNYGIAATPGFQGYIFADCTFPLAQGWGFMPIGAASDGDSIAPEIVTTPRPAGSSTLLFSAVSNRSGNDTNITISNTSEDPLGTSPGAGACTISYFGTTSGGGSAPPPQTSSSIAAGGQLSFSLSHGNAAQGVAATPGFQGYMIADCSFPDAQGIAEVTQVPGQLAATHALSRDAQNNVVVNVQLFNTGGTTVPTALITVAKIGSTNATSIPANPVDIPPGTSVQETVVFPASVGTSGTHAVLKIDGTYVGGSFDFTSNVTLP